MHIIRFNILNEIKRWKVVDAKSLITFTNYRGREENLRQILYRLEKQGFIKSIHTIWGKQKIYTLDRNGYALLGITKINESCLNNETLGHNALCTQVVSDLLNLPTIHGASAESELKAESGVLPDASFFGEKNGVPFKLALEVELTKKSRSRILEKLKFYSTIQLYGFVLYIFSSHKMKNEWEKIIEKNLRPDQEKRFLLFTFEHTKAKNFQNAIGLYQGREQFLKDIFA